VGTEVGGDGRGQMGRKSRCHWNTGGSRWSMASRHGWIRIHGGQIQSNVEECEKWKAKKQVLGKGKGAKRGENREGLCPNRVSWGKAQGGLM